MREVNDKLNLLVQNSGSPNASHTRPNDTTAYAALDVLGTTVTGTLTFANVLPPNVAGCGFIVTGVWMRIDVAAIPSTMGGLRLHMFNAAPADIADNAAFNVPAADRTKYLGYIDIDLPLDLGDTLYIEMNNVNFQRRLAAGSTTLYGVLQTLAAYTPTAQAVKTIGLEVVGV